jgi:hypothetical protein
MTSVQTIINEMPWFGDVLHMLPLSLLGGKLDYVHGPSLHTYMPEKYGRTSGSGNWVAQAVCSSHARMHTRTHRSTHVRTGTRTHARMHARTRARIHPQEHARTHPHEHARTHARGHREHTHELYACRHAVPNGSCARFASHGGCRQGGCGL